MRDDDVRFINACFNVVYEESRDVEFLKYCSDPSIGKNLLRQFVANKNLNKEKSDQYIKNIKVKAQQAVLALSELEWLEENDRACYIVWEELTKGSYYRYPLHPVFIPSSQSPISYATTYSNLGLKLNPSSSKERYNEIVKYFDSVELNLGWRLSLISHLKNICEKILNRRRPFSWLDRENEEQCRWAYDYVRKTDFTFTIPKPNVSIIWSSSIEEVYLAIYFAYDTWQSSEEAKKLFEINFNKAWQQKKYRDNLKGKKACNLVLREDVKNMLDELAKVKGVKLNQLVEQLIEKEYKSI